MADWEQLAKLRREYPKPKVKFGLAEVTRRLKKKPYDPYLLAWRADMLLRLGDAAECRKILLSLYERQTPLTDTRLLSYVYEIQVDLSRSFPSNQYLPHTAGEGVIRAWKNAASRNPLLKKVRLDLWSDFFKCAVKEGCWSDVQLSITQVRGDSNLSKKQLAFTEILAYQLSMENAMETARRVNGPPDPQNNLRRELAYRRLLAAYRNAGSEKEPVQIQNIRDLRFMAEIFYRQGRLAELLDLWNFPPPALKTLHDNNENDLDLLIAQLLGKQLYWKPLADFCLTKLNEQLIRLSEKDGDRMAPRVYDQSWKFWRCIVVALDNMSRQDMLEYVEKIQYTFQGSYGPGLVPKERIALLTHVTMVARVARTGGFALDACRNYWVRYMCTYSCYNDLHRSVESLERHDQVEFHHMITSLARGLVPDTEADDKRTRAWLQAEVNVLKFDYLLTLALAAEPQSELCEGFISSALRLYQIAARLKSELLGDIGTLAITAMLSLYHIYVVANELPGKLGGNTRLLLQAAALSLHMTAGEAGDKNRPLVLLSSRVHLTAGLTTIAFQQWDRVPIKQMLLDTTSYLLLTRISHIHPFDTMKPKRVLPDERLIDSIRAIETMEKKVDELLFTRMKDFQYDQAFELLDAKHRLRSSITKHFCILERRSIARLTGKALDESMELDCKAFRNIKDSRDLGALPGFERHGVPVHWLAMPNTSPNDYSTLMNLELIHTEQELTYRILNKEPIPNILQQEQTNLELVDQSDPYGSDSSDSVRTDESKRAMQYDIDYAWELIASSVRMIYKEAYKTKMIVEKLQILSDEIITSNGTLEMMQWNMEQAQKDDPVNAHIGLHEKIILYWYSRLEQYQVILKFCDFVQESIKKQVHLKAKVQDSYFQMLRGAAKKGTEIIQETARGWIAYLRRGGRAAIKAQIRWGPWSDELRKIIPDDDVHFYAGEYVDSYIDSLEGILKVKVGKK
ncbi:hypothetical protein BU24DRAFT_422309 [Aaosphaeria arxii CBS 175.79]|uniref:Uncharacterized protein n=1 Tax=Aaosphaeria arxii CBS 175.79 TaxID=1450172 RepID=A0A6A5XSS1_9PLEO|nr:uncharacterized protein BU24DRAFT_422309 [Aaosphaeria arxii CBS 175.79]KAF2015993.1 hypothetical protein BU24DRAFT_422309 [Aaosphaeria arxii CBS 175.79]